MSSQIYRRGNTSTEAPTSLNSIATQSPTASAVAPSNPFNKGSSSSFFTAMALLILVLASGALVIRAIYLRRRFRNQVQAAIDAGILNPNKPPVEQTKPEMYEINARSLPGNAVDWHKLLPIAVTTLTSSSDKDPKLSTTTSYIPHPRLTIRQRLNQTLGRSYIPNSTRDTLNEYPEKQHSHDSITIPSQVQVAILIAMPSEYPSIPPLYELEPEEDPKGKRRDSSLHYDSIPDVTFGLSSLFVEPSSHTI